MQAELAAYGADLLLATAGFGVLLAVGLTPSSPLSALGAGGLAYITGAAVVPLAVTVLLALGLPFTLGTSFAIVVVCVVLGAWRLGALPPSRRGGGGRLRTWRSWSPEAWVIVAFAVVFGAFALIGFLNALAMPVTEWDAWTIWGRKAQVLTLHDELPGSFFKNPIYGFAHLDYPLQLPIWEAIHFRAAGSFDLNTLLGHVWLLLVAFIWAVAYLVHAYGRVRPIVWAPVLLLVAVAPAVWQQVSGNADLPLAMFACLGVLALALWLNSADNRLLFLAAVMLAATANMKNEGTATAVAVIVIATVIAVARKLDWRALLLAAGGVVAGGILPWRIWLATQGIEGDLPVGKGLNPGYLLDRIDRVGPSIEALNAQLADQSRWLYLVPVAALLSAAALVSGMGRRVAAFYLSIFAAVWAIFVWSYWISPYELSWHLETSTPRIVTVLVFVCAAAILHLSGIFVAALANPISAESSPSPQPDRGARGEVEQRYPTEVARH